MKYKLEEGDRLENSFATWIRQNFPNYELVWSIYIGHNGYGRMANLPNYPDEEKRIYFAEHSYTVLQSAICIKTILESGIFTQPHNNVTTDINFHISFNAYYASIGKLNDCLTKAVTRIGLSEIVTELKSFYDKRNVILHGRSIPLFVDDLGLVQIPDMNVWDDKHFHWSNAAKLQHEYVEDNVRDTFEKLMRLVNNIYGQIYGKISQEMKESKLKLEPRSHQYYNLAVTSGSTQLPPINSFRQPAKSLPTHSYSHPLLPSNSSLTTATLFVKKGK